MGKSINIAGQRFGRLTAVELLPERSKTGARLWRCLCDCGNEKVATTSALNSGFVQSCGCLMRDVGKENSIRQTVHGDAKHGKWQRLYHVWLSMRQRCKPDGVFKLGGTHCLPSCSSGGKWRVFPVCKTQGG